MTRPVDMLFPDAQRPGAILEGRCVNPPYGCGKPVQGFKNERSKREFGISGMCQECQDGFFDE